MGRETAACRYSGIGYSRTHGLMGRPFWEQGIELFDAVHSVGVRSHYKATLLALPMLRRTASKTGHRGLIVNTNSGGCLFYVLNVPYGMGKCAVGAPLSRMPNRDQAGYEVSCCCTLAAAKHLKAGIKFFVIGPGMCLLQLVPFVDR